MLSDGLKKELQPKIMTMKVLWAAMTMTLFMFTVVFFIILRPTTVAFPNVASPLDLALSFMALTSISASFVLKNLFLSKEGIKKVMQESPSKDKGILELANRYFTNMVIRLAINETIALYGLVLSLVTLRPVLIPFVAIALVINILTFPNYENFAESVLQENF